jgi:hypothetical protein
MKNCHLKTVIPTYAGIMKRRSRYDRHSSLMMKNDEIPATFLKNYVYKDIGLLKNRCRKLPHETVIRPLRSVLRSQGEICPNKEKMIIGKS